MSTPKPGTVVSRSTKQVGRYRVTTEFVTVSPAEGARRMRKLLDVLSDMARRRIAARN